MIAWKRAFTPNLVYIFMVGDNLQQVLREKVNFPVNRQLSEL